MKKYITLFLTLIILCATLCLFGAKTQAATVASGNCGENLTWVLDDTGTLTISGTGDMSDWIVSSDVPWYAIRSGIKTVVIADNVTSVGNYAFFACTGLTSVTISDSVTIIGNSAFSNCSGLTSMTIPDGVTTIGDSAFYNCTGLTSMKIGKRVTTIDVYAFCWCSNLTSITIPDNVTTIGNSAFSNCSGLTSATIGNSVTTIGDNAFSWCSNLTSITIPDNVTIIGDSAFYKTAWYNNQPYGLVYTGKVAYKYKGTCPATIMIKDGTVGIAPSAFSNCTGLTSVTIPDSVTIIGDCAFTFCLSLTSVTIPDSVTTIGDSAFSNCTGLTGIWVDENNKNYSSDFLGVLFNKDKTILIQVPGKLAGAYKIPDNVTTIEKGAFSACTDLTSVTIPDNINTISDFAFSYCPGLTSIAISDTVTTIGDYAFYWCSSLTSVTIPDSVTTIGGSAFGWCTQLKKIEFKGNAPAIDEDAFLDVVTTAYYPANNETWTAEKFQNYGGTLTWEAYWDKVDFAFSRMVLGNSLDFQFALPKGEIENWTGAYAVVTKGSVTKTIPVTSWAETTINGAAHWVITYDGLAAKEMADQILITVYSKDGDLLTNDFTDSVRGYVMRNLEKQSTKGKALMVDMLNYGAAAQSNFGYNTADLANNQLTAAQKAYGSTAKSVTDGRIQGANYQGTRLILESRIQMQVAFKNLKPDLYAMYNFTDHYGQNRTVFVMGNQFVLTNGIYVIELDQIACADSRQPVTVTVYNANGTVYGTATDSIESYVSRMSSGTGLLEALMIFTDSAYNYFH